MKLTESKLQELVLEELELMVENGELDEGFLDRLKARAAGAGEKLKGSAKSAVQRGVGAVQGEIGDKEDAVRTKLDGTGDSQRDSFINYKGTYADNKGKSQPGKTGLRKALEPEED